MIDHLRYALRALFRSPGFTAQAVLMLGLGIGANTAIFSVVNAVLLQPLPFADASRLVAIQSTSGREGDGTASLPDFSDWRKQSTTIDRMAAYAEGSLTIIDHGAAASLPASFVTADLLPLLGARPIVGRTFSEDNDRPGAANVAVISELLWEDRFSRDPAIVGRGLTLDAQPYTVIGVLPATFQFPLQPDRVQLWVPLASVPLIARWKDLRGARFAHTIGHLRSGATLEQARSEMSTIGRRLAASYPQSNSDRSVQVVFFRTLLVHDFTPGLAVLLGAVAAVLLVACGNVASLLIARGVARRKEIAIRAALGASRGRLTLQLLTESVLLSLLAGAAGVVLAMWGVAALIAVSPVEIPRADSVRIDGTVLLFTVVVSIATGVLFGFVPALHSSQVNGENLLTDRGRGSTRSHSRARQMLIVGEVALSLVLLTGAGLLARTFLELRRVNPGFVADRVLTIELSLPEGRYPDDRSQVGFYRRFVEMLPTLPGVQSSGLATSLPMSSNDLDIGFSVEGRPPRDPRARLAAGYFAVSPDYFRTMAIPILRGRSFTPRDDEKTSPVVIVSESMARQYWPGEDPIGKRLVLSINGTGAREIVGIAGDVKRTRLSEEPKPTVYTPYPQTPMPFLVAALRSDKDPIALAASLRTAVARLDPEQPLGSLPLADYVARSMAAPRFLAALVGSFAALAVLLAGFGLYAVTSYSVAQRRQEIGIRMAMGAQPSSVSRIVLLEVVRTAGLGFGIGLVGALLLTRMLGSLLFGVTPTDPVTFLTTCALLLVMIAAAAYWPTRRATGVDPAEVLREAC